METLRREVPRVLEQTTGCPVTEFSTILFQRGIQPKVKSAYTQLSGNISQIQAEIQDSCSKKITRYRANQTPQNAITTAIQLRDDRTQIDTDIKRLRQDGKNTEELFQLYERWRVLAGEIARDRQLMVDSTEDDAVQNLIERLDSVQQDIRQHLATNRMSLKDILSSHEHFRQQCSTIKDEFNKFLTRRKDTFITYQSNIAQQLGRMPDTPLPLVDFNPIDSEGCYRKVRENAVAKLESVVNKVLVESDQRKRELLKPIEVFKVPKALKTKAIQLREDLGKLDDGFQNVRCELTPEEVDTKLSEWVDKLLSKLKEGQPLADRRRQIERELDELRPDLSLKAQRLRNELTDTEDCTDLIVRLRSDENFNSTKEIFESLEELYQANLVDLTVRGKWIG